jgi:hypothetical protein
MTSEDPSQFELRVQQLLEAGDYRRKVRSEVKKELEDIRKNDRNPELRRNLENHIAFLLVHDTNRTYQELGLPVNVTWDGFPVNDPMVQPLPQETHFPISPLALAGGIIAAIVVVALVLGLASGNGSTGTAVAKPTATFSGPVVVINKNNTPTTVSVVATPPIVSVVPPIPTSAQSNSGAVSGVQTPPPAGQIEIPTQEPVNQNVPPTVVVVPTAVPTPVPPARLVVDVTKADGTPFGVCIFIYHQVTDAAGKPTFGDWAGSSGFVCNQSHSSFDVTPGVYAVKFTSGGGSSPSWGYYPEERIFGYEVVEGQTTNVRVTLGRLRVAFLAVDGSALTGAKVWAGSQKSDVNGKPVYGNAMVEGYTGNTGYAEFDLTEGTYALEVWKGCCEVDLKGLQFNKVVVSGEVTEERIRISE